MGTELELWRRLHTFSRAVKHTPRRAPTGELNPAASNDAGRRPTPVGWVRMIAAQAGVTSQGAYWRRCRRAWWRPSIRGRSLGWCRCAVEVRRCPTDWSCCSVQACATRNAHISEGQDQICTFTRRKLHLVELRSSSTMQRKLASDCVWGDGSPATQVISWERLRTWCRRTRAEQSERWRRCAATFTKILMSGDSDALMQ